MPRVKTSLYVEQQTWRDIKSEAARRGMTVGDFVTGVFARWKGEQDAHCNTGNQTGSTTDRHV